ncbi:CRR6 family NdhI maturation factor [Thermosynechococcus sp. QKsg1]|uniref:CRR6 family NdhI maturation factor n=1 Tax=unclassified Thermosynechococcus TaxID=2622553 RepID=UPI0025770B3B|nr:MULTISPECIES: CRR6 family NdhI maturation factor [unclassified Thermosynechococcus]WJI23483.1 CRR6 family NdhI maturation factor [Thermosynechococcus sp. B0]WJI25994.1 CRR6 family NdhI maturation factor [Thermosynechococcus sp. B1]WJI28523.1 CRR6 family NdhI maturation factor [Thermosynechococcus sp. B3]WKT83110.1 CRR6 family NdhI maturation factor [Thermosynechococcus sp. HY596]WNC62237.1 CRR6 family NdhI maturation factor [Thermosynechococcus sp. HY591]
MAIAIQLTPDQIDRLDVSPLQQVLAPLIAEQRLLDHHQALRFVIDYPRPADEPDLELSELPAVRLWFIRADVCYPWLPYLLDWSAGELVRYGAMLVPHEFHPQQGIIFNPQALDIFVMAKVFTLWQWLQGQGYPAAEKIKGMAAMFGYELDTALFDLLEF